MVFRADFFETWRLSLAVMHNTSLVHFDSPLYISLIWRVFYSTLVLDARMRECKRYFRRCLHGNLASLSGMVLEVISMVC